LRNYYLIYRVIFEVSLSLLKKGHEIYVVREFVKVFMKTTLDMIT